LGVYANLASWSHLSTYPQSSTTRELHVLMRLHGRRITNEPHWRGAGAGRRAVARSHAVIRARTLVLPHFHGLRPCLTPLHRDA